ncbi:hypothetical protein GGR50DRAFT_698144 [Xylaria sp. CBS 124048]|nr:hypothetical protein GGR50DRAFT_698144 [Xylaria sp. CBS 124048]
MSVVRKAGRATLHRWHGLLNLPHYTQKAWYQARYNEELAEFRQARTRLEKLSEESDVFFALSRANYDGFPVGELPVFEARHILVYVYMISKYTSRWAFFRVLALLCRAPHPTAVREVVNASKDAKLFGVALRHQIDPERFTTIGRRLRVVWPLLP